MVSLAFQLPLWECPRYPVQLSQAAWGEAGVWAAGAGYVGKEESSGFGG